MTIEQLAKRFGISVETVRMYVARGLLPRPHRHGRKATYGQEHAERLARTRELRDQGKSLSAIAAAFGVGPGVKIPTPDSWLHYRLDGDVVVLVRSSVSPWKHKHIREGIEVLVGRITDGVPDSAESPARSDEFAEILQNLGIGFTWSTDRPGSIDRNKVLRVGDGGRSLKSYFNDGTARRECYIAMARTLFVDFDWQHWRDAETHKSEPLHFQKIPIEGQEKEALEHMLSYARGRWAR